MVPAADMLSNGTGRRKGRPRGQVSASKGWQSIEPDRSKVRGTRAKNRGQNEDQGQKPQVDVVVPGSYRGDATVFRPGAPGGICFVRIGVWGDCGIGWSCLYAAQRL